LKRDDFEAHYAMVGSDPQVTWQRQAHSREQAQAALDARLQHWDEHSFGMWAVIDRATEQLLGHGGLQHLEGGADVEVGYYLGQSAWGRGLATELGRAALHYGFAHLQLPQIVAVVRPDNLASQRVLAKLGLRYSHDAFHYSADVQVWRISATK
jgi:ribosomal-protein-alanine N-acetyltransferase